MKCALGGGLPGEEAALRNASFGIRTEVSVTLSGDPRLGLVDTLI